MADISVITVNDLRDDGRWDAEAYSPELRELLSVFSEEPRLNDLATVTHPAEIPRLYTFDERGVPFILAANIRPVLPNLATVARIPPEVAEDLTANRVETGDSLVTRTGANHGVACVYLGESGAYYTSGEGLIVRKREDADIDSEYLGAFLASRYGAVLCRRAAYGSGQPHIAPPYLRQMPVPRFESCFEREIGALVRAAWKDSRAAGPSYNEAEQILLDCLNWRPQPRPSEPTLFGHNFRNMEKRWDAEFFGPQAKRLRDLLGKSGKAIRDYATLGEEEFEPQPGMSFNYIEIGDVGDIGDLMSEAVSGENAASRATWIVHKGDVLTTTVRPIRRLSAVVSARQDGYVCSNGFAVLRPEGVESEVLMAYLRLPPVCELMDLYTTATMYPAISVADLLEIPISLPDESVCDEVASLVRKAASAKALARSRVAEALETVNKAVERRLR